MKELMTVMTLPMRLLVTMTVLTTIGGLAGCGGSSSEDAAQPLSRASFVKQGEAICRDSAKQRAAALEQAATKISRNSTVAEQEAAVRALLPPISQMASDLRELPPPRGDEEEVEAILVALEKSVTEGEKNPATAANGTAFNEFDERLGRYGMPGCAI